MTWSRSTLDPALLIVSMKLVTFVCKLNGLPFISSIEQIINNPSLSPLMPGINCQTCHVQTYRFNCYQRRVSIPPYSSVHAVKYIFLFHITFHVSGYVRSAYSTTTLENNWLWSVSFTMATIQQTMKSRQHWSPIYVYITEHPPCHIAPLDIWRPLPTEINFKPSMNK